ncbi:arabinogalactan peptide 20 [Eutrema salsugineum]|uniref:arabinogalactan peptide 20 n=1 Tax=Eutrema salsugineum TaxID=72664 RepID=UPI000CED7090|nr:arabinogalactan peptide 20 [Eutrema salsugineum]
MSVSRLFFGVLTIVSIVFSILLPMAQAQSTAPAPAPISDGTTIDQGIACVLMLVALVLTYLIH